MTVIRRVAVVFNPAAHRGLAARQRPAVEAALAQAGLQAQWWVSTAAGQVRPLTAQAVREDPTRPVLIAGGDGTIGQALNGMADALGLDAPTWPAVGFFPLGSANDLVSNVGLPRDLTAVAYMVARGRTRSMDVLEVNGVLFANNAGVGLEPYISMAEKRIQRVRGVLRYGLAAVQGVWDNPHWHMRLTWDDGQVEGMLSLVSVGNWPRTGGLFYPTPGADGFDGRLTFLYARAMSRPRLLRTLGYVLHPSGRHVRAAGVAQHHATRLEVVCTPGAPLHADGEIQTTAGERFAFRVHPGRLRIFWPTEPGA